MGKKKKKPSAYNRHIAREMKGGKKNMKQAAASWNKKKSPSKKTTSKKRTSKPRKKTTRKQTTRRRKPRAQKVLFPAVRRIMRNGPVRAKVRAILGGR